MNYFSGRQRALQRLGLLKTAYRMNWPQYRAKGVLGRTKQLLTGSRIEPLERTIQTQDQLADIGRGAVENVKGIWAQDPAWQAKKVVDTRKMFNIDAKEKAMRNMQSILDTERKNVNRAQGAAGAAGTLGVGAAAYGALKD